MLLPVPMLAATIIIITAIMVMVPGSDNAAREGKTQGCNRQEKSTGKGRHAFYCGYW